MSTRFIVGDEESVQMEGAEEEHSEESDNNANVDENLETEAQAEDPSEFWSLMVDTM